MIISKYYVKWRSARAFYMSPPEFIGEFPVRHDIQVISNYDNSRV